MRKTLHMCDWCDKEINELNKGYEFKLKTSDFLDHLVAAAAVDLHHNCGIAFNKAVDEAQDVTVEAFTDMCEEARNGALPFDGKDKQP